MADQLTEISAFYDKLRSRIMKRQQAELTQLNRAEKAAERVFQKSPAAPANGAPRVRRTRLDPEVGQAIIASMSASVSYTIKDIMKVSKASRSQVRACIKQMESTGTVSSEGGKRNKKYRLTGKPVEDANHVEQ